MGSRHHWVYRMPRARISVPVTSTLGWITSTPSTDILAIEAAPPPGSGSPPSPESAPRLINWQRWQQANGGKWLKGESLASSVSSAARPPAALGEKYGRLLVWVSQAEGWGLKGKFIDDALFRSVVDAAAFELPEGIVPPTPPEEIHYGRRIPPEEPEEHPAGSVEYVLLRYDPAPRVGCVEHLPSGTAPGAAALARTATQPPGSCPVPGSRRMTSATRQSG